jgi:hypothetical protein
MKTSSRILIIGVWTLATATMLYAVAAFSARSFPGQVVGTDAVCDSFTPTVDSGTVTLTCVPGGSPPPGAPQGCAGTVNSSTSATLSSAGGTVTLAASCGSPSTGLTWNWSRNGAFGASSAASWVDTLAANSNQTADRITSYQVRACTGANCVTVPTTPLVATVTHAGGGAGPATCAGFDNTINLDFGWTSGRQIAPMGPNDAIVVKFTTGNLDSASNNLPRFSGAEWGSPPSFRKAVMSSTPCDFGPQSTLGATSAGNSIQVPFAVGSGSSWGFYPALAKNTTYYLNVKNLTPAESCSNQGICQMFIELSKPSGV